MPIDSSADLLNLLAMCEPSNQKLEKAAQIETLTASPAYQRLAQDARFATLFEQYYSPEALGKLSLARIRGAKGAIPVAGDCLRTIARSIYTGGAPSLTKDDFPDFYSAASLTTLADKLKADDQCNYTNIPELDFMEIFSDVTIRDAREVFGQFDENSVDYAVQIEKAAQGRPYCIPEAQVEHVEAQYEDALARLDAAGRNSTRGWMGDRKHRLWVTLGVLTLLAVIYVIGGLREPLIEGAAIAIISILGIIFIIWG